MKILPRPDQTGYTEKQGTVTKQPRPDYQSCLRRKADLLLKKQGDRPLRNQQRRIIARAQRLRLVGGQAA